MQMCRDKFLHSYKFRHRAAIVLQRGRSNFFAFHGTSGEQKSFSFYAEEERENAWNVTEATAESEMKAGDWGTLAPL